MIVKILETACNNSNDGVSVVASFVSNIDNTL